MCGCDQQMGKLPYSIQTSNGPDVYPEIDIVGDRVVVDGISGEVLGVEQTESSQTTKQSNWFPILILTAIGLFALKGMK